MASMDRLPSEVTIYLRDDHKGIVADWSLEDGLLLPDDFIDYCTVAWRLESDGSRSAGIETDYRNERYGERHDSLRKLSVNADYYDERGNHVFAKGVLYDRERDDTPLWALAHLERFP